MAVTLRPRRSVLYMPGSNARAQDKARGLDADGIILDLEDSTSPDAKAEARALVAASVRAGGYGRRELIVRINALATPWGAEDLAAIAPTGPDAVLIPKVESAEQVLEVERRLTAAGAPASTSLWCMIETPLGVLEARSIAASSPRLACLVMGTSDLTKDLHAEHQPGREPMLPSLGLTLLAARAYGLIALDGVHLDLDDAEGFVTQCEQGRALGFDGKTLIHPKQLAPCNAVFSPTAAALEHAARVVEAHAAAEREGKGVVLLDGKLVENLHVAEAQRLIALAAAIAER